MPSTYSNLKIQLMATGENNTTWGNVTNVNLGTALEEAIVGSADVAFSNANVTLTLTDTNATQSARNMRLNLTGTATAGYNLVVPAIEKPYIVNNGTDGTITVKNTTGTGIAVPAGKTMWVFNNGTNVVDVVTHLSSATLGSALPVASGGTGQTTYTNGQLLIGNTTGNTLTKATLTAGTNISITNGAGAITINATDQFVGTVTSVSGTGTVNGITLTGTVTSSGSLTLGGALSGVDLATQTSGTLAVARGGTGLTSTPANGALDIGNGTGFTRATLTAGSGVSITNGAGSITIAATGSGGTVTSVNASGGTTGMTFSGGPITTSGTLTLSGTLAVANGGTGVTTSTGTGSVVLSNSPVLVTPTLGVASATSIAAAFGSAAAPSYTFTGDTNTGMFSPAADTIAFSEGGAEAMRIDSSGNLLVGTTSATGRLTVQTAGSDVGYFDTTDTTGGPKVLALRSIAASGASTPTLAIRQWRTSFAGSQNAGEIRFDGLTTSGGYAEFASIYAISGANSASGAPTAITFQTMNASYVTGERMRIDSSGNVGIGTSAPSFARLQVSNAGAEGFEFGPAVSAGVNRILSYNRTSNTYNTLRLDGADLQFFTGGSERFRITSTGGITSSDLADAVGYKGVPQNAQTASYTLALSDMGKHISITTGGVVIPANSSVAFPIGSTIVVYNNSASAQNISITTDTLRLAGTATTGTRSLAQRGLATCVKVASTEWVVSGNVT